MLAQLSCTPELNEEEGGFIIHNDKTGEFEFHKVTNANTGEKIARVLFTADAQEYGDKVLTKVLTGKWVEYASFHTHPRGCEPYPSKVDLTQLFKGFPINYIYAPHMDKLVCYTYDKENKRWLANLVKLKRPNQKP